MANARCWRAYSSPGIVPFKDSSFASAAVAILTPLAFSASICACDGAFVSLNMLQMSLADSREAFSRYSENIPPAFTNLKSALRGNEWNTRLEAT